MSDTPADVLVPGYQDTGMARRDCDGLVGLVKGWQGAGWARAWAWWWGRIRAGWSGG